MDDYITRVMRIPAGPTPVGCMMKQSLFMLELSHVQNALSMLEAAIADDVSNPETDLNEIVGDMLHGREGETPITDAIKYIIDHATNLEYLSIKWAQINKPDAPPSYKSGVIEMLIRVLEEFNTIVISSETSERKPKRKRRHESDNESLISSSETSNSDESDD